MLLGLFAFAAVLSLRKRRRLKLIEETIDDLYFIEEMPITDADLDDDEYYPGAHPNALDIELRHRTATVEDHV